MAYNLTGLNVINGTPAAETLTGTLLNDAIYGNGGADVISGGLGKDILFGGSDGVTFHYSADSLWVSVNAVNSGDPLAAGPGTSFALTGYSQSQDVFVGSGTNNTLLMGDGHHALFLEDALSPTVDTVRLVNIQTIVGGSGGQVIDLTSTVFTYGDVTILGGSGNDTIMSNAGHDTLSGGDGNDYVWGGSGNDMLSGGDGNDQLLGGNGDDILDGGVGNDAMTGGNGNDTYYVDATSDVLTETSTGGIDTVVSSINLTLGSNLEHLTLTGAALNGTGNSLANTITGNANANVLNGGTGADTLIGGLGNDVYVVDSASDVVVEADGEGTDTVQSSVSYTLSAQVENLTLTGTSGTSGTGNALANLIVGNSGANTLNGGLGADTLQGGTGNDTYYVDDAGDVVVEASGGGTDTVRASLDYTLGSNVEYLILGGTADLKGTGNTLANRLTGNSGNNTLDGGTGADTMTGGQGADTYYVDNSGDSIVENAGEGLDHVISAISHTLASNVENLTLTGTANLSGTGNTLANVITGNSGNNTLSASGGNDTLDGGLGNDTMSGGTGNDTFIVAQAGDVVSEATNAGTDLVLSSITYTLTSNVENLTLTGTDAIDGTGNTLNNTITGNAAANVLTGGGGNDFIIGGGGNDTIVGGNGNDNLWGQDGNDVITAGGGRDNVNGGAGTDTLYAGDGDDGLFGGGMNDALYGQGGNDSLYGDGGDDLIVGGAGNDWLVGGQLANGFSVGNDTFAWSRSDIVNGSGTRVGFDTIVDFGAGDRLDFSGVFAGQPAAPIADLVRVTDYYNGTLVSVNIAESGGWVDAMILRDVHGIDLDDLIGQNAIVV